MYVYVCLCEFIATYLYVHTHIVKEPGSSRGTPVTLSIPSHAALGFYMSFPLKVAEVPWRNG